jgi:hypothetical protein
MPDSDSSARRISVEPVKNDVGGDELLLELAAVAAVAVGIAERSEDR